MTDKVKITTLDNTANYLQDKITAGDNVTITKNESGGTETLEITATYPTGVTANTNNIAALDAETTPVRIKCIHGIAGSLVNKAVFITGWDSTNLCVTVEVSDNLDSTTMPSIGLCDSISDSVTGYIVVEGMYSDFDTSGYSAGDKLYVDESGALTSTAPTGSDIVQEFGVVGKVDASIGEIIINTSSSVSASLTADTISRAGRKETSGTLAKGKVTYISGYDATNGFGLREYAIADDSSKMPGMGVVSQEMTDSITGRVVCLGSVSGLNTDDWDIGDKLYVSDTVAGDLTSTRPTGESNLVQNIAVCVYKHATNGIIAVINPATFEDIPNLDDGNFWLGGSGNTATTENFDDYVSLAIDDRHTSVGTAIPTGTTETLDLSYYLMQHILLDSATGDVTLTLNNPVAGYVYRFRIEQGDITARNLIWPSNVMWPGGVAPTITTTLSAIDYIELWWNGSEYLGRFEQDYS